MKGPKVSATERVLNLQEESTLNELRRTILELPLAELVKLKRDGIKGEPLYRALGFKSETQQRDWFKNDGADANDSGSEDNEEPKLHGSKSTINHEESSNDDDSSSEDGQAKAGLDKRKRRRAPLELKSNRQVSRKREVVPIVSALKSGRDPRFSHQQVDMNLHRARFDFLEEQEADEINEKKKVIQRELLARQLKATRRGRRLKRLSDDELAEMRADLTRLEQHRAETNRAKLYSDQLRALKRKTGASNSSTGAFIPTKAKKELAREIKFKDLEERHHLEKYMKKKQKMSEIKSTRKDSKGPQLGV